MRGEGGPWEKRSRVSEKGEKEGTKTRCVYAWGMQGGGSLKFGNCLGTSFPKQSRKWLVFERGGGGG